MKIIYSYLLLLLGFMANTTMAQNLTAQDSLLDKLAGKWVLQGKIEGKETTHDIQSDWVLDHQYLQIREVSREKDKNGNSEYSAIVYLCWERGSRQYTCLWLDNTGNGGLSKSSLGHAKAGGDIIEFQFPNGDGSSFRNTFTYDRFNNTWRWRMEGEENGIIQPFADVKLTRGK